MTVTSIYLKPSSKYYYARLKNQRGQWCDKSTKMTNYSSAKRVAERLQAEELLKRDALEQNNRSAIQDVTFDEAVKLYHHELKVRNCTDKYVREVVKQLNHFREQIGLQRLEQVTLLAINKFASMLFSSDLSDRTIQKYVRGIQGFVKWCSEVGIASENRITAYKFGKLKRVVRRRCLRPEGGLCRCLSAL